VAARQSRGVDVDGSAVHQRKLIEPKHSLSRQVDYEQGVFYTSVLTADSHVLHKTLETMGDCTLS